MLRDIVNKLKKEILKEATGDSTGARGSYVLPLSPGKRLFDKNQLAPFTQSVSDYDSQLLATDSYDGSMGTPKKDIKNIESKAKKASIYAKNHPIRNDDDGDILNPFPGHHIKRPDNKKISSPFNKKVNESTSTFLSAGEYNGPQELGMKKWHKNSLSPFTEFVDSEINHEKVKSSTKNNIKRTVGVWEKGKDGTHNVETHDVHTINEWKYEEAPVLTEDLAVWFGTKKKPKGSSQPKGPWVNICRKVDGKHPPCGRSEADTKGYPKCRAAGVAGKMSDSQKKAACAQKRKAEKKDPKIGTGNKPTMTSYKPKKK
jgi:hypothetical protein